MTIRRDPLVCGRDGRRPLRPGVAGDLRSVTLAALAVTRPPLRIALTSSLLLSLISLFHHCFDVAEMVTTLASLLRMLVSVVCIHSISSSRSAIEPPASGIGLGGVVTQHLSARPAQGGTRCRFSGVRPLSPSSSPSLSNFSFGAQPQIFHPITASRLWGSCPWSIKDGCSLEFGWLLYLCGPKQACERALILAYVVLEDVRHTQSSSACSAS